MAAMRIRLTGPEGPPSRALAALRNRNRDGGQQKDGERGPLRAESPVQLESIDAGPPRECLRIQSGNAALTKIAPSSGIHGDSRAARLWLPHFRERASGPRSSDPVLTPLAVRRCFGGPPRAQDVSGAVQR